MSASDAPPSSAKTEIEEDPSEPCETSDEECEDVPVGAPMGSGGIPSLFQNMFGGGGDLPQHELDDVSMLAAYAREVLQMDDNEEEPSDTGDGEKPTSSSNAESTETSEPPSKYDVTGFVLSKYREAGVKIYPEEVKAQVRMLLLAYHTDDTIEDPALDPVMVRLVKDIWAS